MEFACKVCISHGHTFINPKMEGGVGNSPKLKKRNFSNVSSAFLKSRSAVSPDEF